MKQILYYPAISFGFRAYAFSCINCCEDISGVAYFRMGDFCTWEAAGGNIDYNGIDSHAITHTKARLSHI